MILANVCCNPKSDCFKIADEGKVYVWDVRQRKCLHRFIDEGCLGGLSLSLSAGDQYLACGSTSGVVNIYSGSTVLPSKGVPTASSFIIFFYQK